MSSDHTTIAIMQEEIPAHYQEMDIHKLDFLRDNPRVYAATQAMSDFDHLTSEEIQERIYKCLLEEQSVKNLIPEIKRDGGLQEAIIVRHDKSQVIEGNSRLAVYRKLYHETADERWKHIRCLVVSTLSEELQTRLLAQTHLHGKTEWSRYTKALQCFRWVNENRNIATLAEVCGFSKDDIRKSAETIELMKANCDEKQSHFSYYSVLVRNKAISLKRKENPGLEQRLLDEIKEEKFTAQEMRDRLPTIINKPRILRKYEQGSITLEDAFERAKISDTEQRLKKVRDRLSHIEKNDIDQLEHNELKAAQQVVRGIKQELKRVADMIEVKIAETRR